MLVSEAMCGVHLCSDCSSRFVMSRCADTSIAPPPPHTVTTSQDDDGAAAGAAGSEAKRTQLDISEWHNAAQKGTLDKYTMPVLKEFLKSVGQPVSGKKDELVDRVKTYLSKHKP